MLQSNFFKNYLINLVSNTNINVFQYQIYKNNYKKKKLNKNFFYPIKKKNSVSQTQDNFQQLFPELKYPKINIQMFIYLLNTINKVNNFFFYFQYKLLFNYYFFNLRRKKNWNKQKVYWLKLNKKGVRTFEKLTKTCTPSIFFKIYKKKRILKKKVWLKYKTLKLKLWKSRKSSVNFYKFNTLDAFPRIKFLENFSTSERVFLTQKIIKNKLMSFYYKSVKNDLLTKKKTYFYEKKRGSTYFLNANKPLIWKMRLARFAHWEIRTKGKLNKYRYDKLLLKDLNLICKTKIKSLILVIIFNYYSLLLSWKQAFLLLFNQLIVINGDFVYTDKYLKEGDIIELPYGLEIFKFKKFLKKKYTVIIRQIKKKSYLNFLSRRNKHIRKSRTILKIFKKAHIGLKNLGIKIVYDPIFNVLLILNFHENFYHDVKHFSIKTSVLSIQNWRYNFD